MSSSRPNQQPEKLIDFAKIDRDLAQSADQASRSAAAAAQHALTASEFARRSVIDASDPASREVSRSAQQAANAARNAAEAAAINAKNAQQVAMSASPPGSPRSPTASSGPFGLGNILEKAKHAFFGDPDAAQMADTYSASGASPRGSTGGQSQYNFHQSETSLVDQWPRPGIEGLMQRQGQIARENSQLAGSPPEAYVNLSDTNAFMESLRARRQAVQQVAQDALAAPRSQVWADNADRLVHEAISDSQRAASGGKMAAIGADVSNSIQQKAGRMAGAVAQATGAQATPPPIGSGINTTTVSGRLPGGAYTYTSSATPGWTSENYRAYQQSSGALPVGDAFFNRAVPGPMVSPRGGSTAGSSFFPASLNQPGVPLMRQNQQIDYRAKTMGQRYSEVEHSAAGGKSTVLDESSTLGTA
ncbi:hypothetical protein H696_00409 [Fonticula alba]|uniref:Uncharacterized protein n=1 Tax=Fonticula alba TaxID=691883 RepID=A0A058ZFY2_FONAL|nr:hypothetical protein H696_00409 [Fonticula alba]KCV72833.1 hypothetical protein H696_00409 [Fonticula alba]|eukprot:XP_009492534.1 hypothetical protein H696_00409 [Fonticula alba]